MKQVSTISLIYKEQLSFLPEYSFCLSKPRDYVSSNHSSSVHLPRIEIQSNSNQTLKSSKSKLDARSKSKQREETALNEENSTKQGTTQQNEGEMSATSLNTWQPPEDSDFSSYIDHCKESILVLPTMKEQIEALAL